MNCPKHIDFNFHDNLDKDIDIVIEQIDPKTNYLSESNLDKIIDSYFANGCNELKNKELNDFSNLDNILDMLEKFDDASMKRLFSINNIDINECLKLDRNDAVSYLSEKSFFRILEKTMEDALKPHKHKSSTSSVKKKQTKNYQLIERKKIWREKNLLKMNELYEKLFHLLNLTKKSSNLFILDKAVDFIINFKMSHNLCSNTDYEVMNRIEDNKKQRKEYKIRLSERKKANKRKRIVYEGVKKYKNDKSRRLEYEQFRRKKISSVYDILESLLPPHLLEKQIGNKRVWLLSITIEYIQKLIVC